MRRHRRKIVAWVAAWAKAGLLILLWIGCDWLSRRLHSPIPSGVLGLMLLLAALALGFIRSDWLRPGVGRLLGHMLLFFIPAMMAPLAHHELFGPIGLKILAVIVLSTVSVMLSTGLIVEACFRWRWTRGAETAPAPMGNRADA
ncbi:MAG TPA: CidA/LrgA family protein [Terriglobia bacterium]|nr:CidA/LrgA family protein [Terriglobia bacterium]